MVEITKRFDGLWNVWCKHRLEMASEWQVIHVARTRKEAIQWLERV